MRVTKAFLIFNMYKDYMKFNKKLLKANYKGLYLFEILVDEEKSAYQYYLIDFDNLNVTWQETPFEKYDVKFSTDDATMLKITNKQVNPSKLVAEKKIKAEGKQEYIIKLTSDFFPTAPKL
ncbi:hypothetical protein ABPG74_017705 [Tetrahymena malaccensis]